MFQPRLLSYNLVDMGQFRLKIGLTIRLIIRFIILQQQLGKAMSVMHFSKLSVRSFFPPAPFFCEAMFESRETQKIQLHLLIHSCRREIFLISPSLKCREHIFEYSVTLKCFRSSLLIACSHFFFIWFSVGNLK